MQQSYTIEEVQEIVISQLRPLSLDDLESGIWNADVDSFLQVQNAEFIDGCDDIEDPSDFLKLIFFKILKEKYCPPEATIDLTETDDEEDHEDDYEDDNDSLQAEYGDEENQEYYNHQEHNGEGYYHDGEADELPVEPHQQDYHHYFNHEQNGERYYHDVVGNELPAEPYYILEEIIPADMGNNRFYGDGHNNGGYFNDGYNNNGDNNEDAERADGYPEQAVYALEDIIPAEQFAEFQPQDLFNLF